MTGEAEESPPLHPEVTPKKLLTACQRFADKLAEGQWLASSERRRVMMTRSFSDVIGHTSQLDVKRVPVTETLISTEATFSGHKSIYDDSDVTPILEEEYHVSVKVRMSLHDSELPEHIAAFLRERPEEDTVYRLAARHRKPYGTNTSLAREQEFSYFIDDNGMVVDYIFAERFLENNVIIDQMTYGLDDAGENFSTRMPAGVVDSRPLEWQKIQELPLSEEKAAEFFKYFDAALQHFYEAEAGVDLLKQGRIPDEEHRRRAFGMVAMTASGFRLMRGEGEKDGQRKKTGKKKR